MNREYYLKLADAKAAYAGALRMEAGAEDMIGNNDQAEAYREFASRWDAHASAYRALAAEQEEA